MIIPETFKSKEELEFYIQFLQEELETVSEIFKKDKVLRKNEDGRELRGWKQRCNQHLNALKTFKFS